MGYVSHFMGAYTEPNATPVAALRSVEPQLVVRTRRIGALIDERHPRFVRGVGGGTLRRCVTAIAEFRLRARAAPRARDQQHVVALISMRPRRRPRALFVDRRAACEALERKRRVERMRRSKGDRVRMQPSRCGCCLA